MRKILYAVYRNPGRNVTEGLLPIAQEPIEVRFLFPVPNAIAVIAVRSGWLRRSRYNPHFSSVNKVQESRPEARDVRHELGHGYRGHHTVKWDDGRAGLAKRGTLDSVDELYHLTNITRPSRIDNNTVVV